MIEITWGNLRNNDYMASLSKLFAAPMPFVNAQKFVLLGRETKKQQKMLEETHKKLLETFGTPEEGKQGYFKIPEENTKAYGEEMEKLYSHKFQVRINKFNAEELSRQVEFSPQDLILLDNILLPLDEQADAPKENQEAQAEAQAH